MKSKKMLTQTSVIFFIFILLSGRSFSNEAHVRSLKSSIEVNTIIKDKMDNVWKAITTNPSNETKDHLHQLYAQYPKLRKKIRLQMREHFEIFINGGTAIGIEEVLEVYQSISSGFKIPLRDEHQSMKDQVLIPLLEKVEEDSKIAQIIDYTLKSYGESNNTHNAKTEKAISPSLKEDPYASISQKKIQNQKKPNQNKAKSKRGRGKGILKCIGKALIPSGITIRTKAEVEAEENKKFEQFVALELVSQINKPIEIFSPVSHSVTEFRTTAKPNRNWSGIDKSFSVLKYLDDPNNGTHLCRISDQGKNLRWSVFMNEKNSVIGSLGVKGGIFSNKLKLMNNKDQEVAYIERVRKPGTLFTLKDDSCLDDTNFSYNMYDSANTLLFIASGTWSNHSYVVKNTMEEIVAKSEGYFTGRLDNNEENYRMYNVYVASGMDLVSMVAFMHAIDNFKNFGHTEN